MSAPDPIVAVQRSSHCCQNATFVGSQTFERSSREVIARATLAFAGGSLTSSFERGARLEASVLRTSSATDDEARVVQSAPSKP